MAGPRPSARSFGSGAVPEELASPQSTPDPTPKLNVDPVWSLKPWPAVVLLGGREFDIPAMAAADWLAYLMQPSPDLDGLILDLLGSSEELLYADEITVEELYEAALSLISTVCARPWWVALRQTSVARNSWHVLGPKMLERIDFERVSIAAFLDILLVVTLESIDPKSVTMFVMKLEAVPAEAAAEQPAPIDSMEMDRGVFLSLQ